MAEKDRVRKTKLQVFLTDEEMKILEEKCKEFNMTKSGYIRGAILYGGVKESQPRVEKELIEKLIYEVNKIGNNINQIAYANNVKFGSTVAEMTEAKEQLYAALGMMVDTLNYI